VLEREFDSGALAGLREVVLGYAIDCGMPEDRALDVMLAVHELAANAVRHGPGYGRLRMHATASTLRCEVSDLGPYVWDGHAVDGTGDLTTAPWPFEQGHGLWLARQAADHLRVTSGPRGSLIALAFTLPAAAAPSA